jgi:hypothetical protein
MSRSELGEAALNGDLDRLKQLIASGALLDGSDGETYEDDTPGCVRGAPYYRPLGEAARMNHPDCVRALLDAGAKIDDVNYTGETALISAVRQDALEPVKILLERGADVHHVACLGTALAAIQPGYYPNAIEIGKLLLAKGASPTTTASYARSALERWRDQVPSRGKVDKKVGKATLEMLKLVLPRVEGKDAADLRAAIGELEAKLGVSAKAEAREADRFAKLAEAKGGGWAKDVGALLGDIGKEKNRAAIEQVCKVVLTSSSAVAHDAWPQLVVRALGLSRTYGDVTLAAYGERLSVSQMGDDEGSAMDFYADDHLYTFDWVLATLAAPTAIAHPQWADLVLAVCDAKAGAVGYYSYGDEEIAALLAVPEATQHPRYAELVGVAREAFPYAQCFGANGALRDFKGDPRTTPPQPLAITKAAAKPAKTAPRKVGPKKAAPKKTAPKKSVPKKAAAKKKPAPKKKRR